MPRHGPTAAREQHQDLQPHRGASRVFSIATSCSSLMAARRALYRLRWRSKKGQRPAMAAAPTCSGRWAGKGLGFQQGVVWFT